MSKTKQTPPAPEPPQLDEATRQRILQADLANVVKKVKSGKPLSYRERRLITEAHQTLPEGFSVSALSRMLGHDRATVRRHVTALTPCTIRRGVKYYRLTDLEKTLASKPDKNLREAKLFQECRKLRIANDRAENLVILSRIHAVEKRPPIRN